MSNNAYGVVVKQYSACVGIWQLFRNASVRLTSLDPSVLEYPLHFGDIVQGRTEGDETRIVLWWPFPDSVWSDGRRVIVRTIVSCDYETAIKRGTWRDEETGLMFALLISRDIGIIAAPVPWYNREVFEPRENHLYVYAEFLERTLTNTETKERVDYHWAVVDDRVSLPVTPSTDENPEKFLLPLELRKVPAIVLARQGNSVFVWSYALGDHMAIIEVDEKSAIGQWMEVTVNRSSPRDFGSHGCKYTVLRRNPVGPYAYPQVKVANKRIEMSLNLNRNDLDPANPRAPMMVWHDPWGLAVGYSEALAAWIRAQKSQFRATVEIEANFFMAGAGIERRRAAIKIISPAVEAKSTNGPAQPIHSTTAADPLEGLDELKKAVQAADKIENDNNNNTATNNNNNDDGWYNWAKKDHTTKTGQSSDGQKTVQNPSETKESNPWLDIPKMTMRSSASTTPQKTTPKKKDKVEKLDWKNFGKTEEEKEKKGSGKMEKKPVTVTPGYTGSIGSVWGDDSSLGGFRSATDDDASTGFGRKSQYSEKTECTEKSNDGVKGAFVGFGKMPQYSEKADGTEKSSDGVKTGFQPMVPTKAPTWKAPTKPGYEPVMAAAPVPIRAYDDKLTEMAWRKEMKLNGWKWPSEPKEIKIPDGDDGWELMGSKTFGKHPKSAPPPMPAEVLLKRRNFINEAMRIKRLRCLITKVRFSQDWKTPIRVQLFVLEGIPAFVTHRLDDQAGNNISYLIGRPEFTTVGNVVDLHIGRHTDGWYVNDEMWRFCEKVKLPWREAVNEQSRVKSLELIVNAKCLEEQETYNHRQRYDNNRITKLSDEILNEILYMGDAIDPKEHDDYTFQVVVIPEVAGHAFWKATEVLWRVQKESMLDLFARPQRVEPVPQQRVFLPKYKPKLKPPVVVEFKPTNFSYNQTAASTLSHGSLTFVSRETRMSMILTLYKDILETDQLVDVLHERFGIDYRAKFYEAIEVAESAAPHQKSVKKELQVNADFLALMVHNPHMGDIFRAHRGGKRLWRRLEYVADNVKAFRCTVNFR